MKNKNLDYMDERAYVQAQSGIQGNDWTCYALRRRGWRVWITRTPVPQSSYKQDRGADAMGRWIAAEYLRAAPAPARKFIPYYTQRDLDNSLPQETQYKLCVCVVATVQGKRVFGCTGYGNNNLRECLKSAIERCHHAIRHERCRTRAQPSREPGYYLRLAAERVATALDRQHLPTDDRKWIAVEIECVVESRKTLRETMAASALLRQHVTIKSDASLSAGDLSVRDCVEVVVCAPRETYRELLAAVCGVITACHGAVNRSCGLHVHLDQRNLPLDAVQAVYTRLAAAQPLLRRFVSASRLGEEGDRYCARSPRVWSTGSRYRAINACAYQTHRTLEIRLHQGTIDATKITNWVALLIAIADCPWMPQRERRVTARWLDAYGIEPALRDYWLARMAAFGRADLPPAQRPRAVAQHAQLHA